MTVTKTNPTRTVLLCSCEGTMPTLADAVGKGCKDSKVVTAKHLCGAELDLFRRHTTEGLVTVACTAQRPLFEEVCNDGGLGAKLTFANVRETAGWSTEATEAGAKTAALIAMAAVAVPASAAITLHSDGVALIYGRGQVALDVAMALKDRLDITVLLSEADDIAPPATMEFPIRRGRIKNVTGHLGAFEVTIDGFASPHPSSRRTLTFGPPRNGAKSKTDMLIDLSGDQPFVTAPELREGYLRADPGNPLAVARLLLKAADLVGTFDKPRYIDFSAELCAHARSRKIGCTRCLDVCPAGAITPAGNVVAIDPHICAGCGQCAAACPTGAAAYTMPSVDILLMQIRTAAQAYYDAGGRSAALLLHDHAHGSALIDACARFGNGLPAHVVPIAVNEVTQVGLETIAAACAYGFRPVQLLTRSKPQHDIGGLRATVATASAVLTGLGYGADAISLIETDDPDQLHEALSNPKPTAAPPARASFLALGSKRDVMKLSLRELHRIAPAPQARIELPKGAVFGGLAIDTANCTLCLSCVSACPTSALGDASDRPLLSFDESLCVQCGLCVATCPETVITLSPRIDFEAFETGAKTVKEEAPFQCITCGKAFGVKSTIEKVTAKLKDKHWMFSGEHKSRIDLIQKCDDCRVEAMTNAKFDPYAAVPRPNAKTTDDYFKDREIALREATMKAMIDKGEV